MDGRSRLDLALKAAAEIEPAAAQAAARSLDTLLGTGHDSDTAPRPESTWSTSVLSRDGYPVELGFVSGAAGLRYTVELPPAGPSRAPGGDRWSRTLAAAHGLIAAGDTAEPRVDSAAGAAAGIAALLDPLRRIQAEAREPLRYGAWLSGRHTAERSRFKLYTEIPPDSAPLWQPWECTLLDRPAPLPTRCPTLRMVGTDLTERTDRVELYYDLSSLHPSEVARLAERVGLEGRAPEILDLLREAVCLPLTHELPARCDWGFSYALEVEPSDSGAPRTRPLAFTLYTFANALFGGDGKIRRALLALARNRSWDGQRTLALYERISEPLAARRGFVTCHGVFGVTVTADPAQPAVATWGLTPPPVRGEDLADRQPGQRCTGRATSAASAGGRR